MSSLLIRPFVKTIFFSVVLLLGIGATATAWQAPNTSSASQTASAEPSAADDAAGVHRTEPGGDKPDGGKKEAAEADDTAQFKQSPVVLALGRKIGLSGNAMYWLAVIINFAIITLAIVYFSRLHLPAMFRNRTDSIRKAMDEAKVASDDAKKRLAGIEARLSRLDSEIAAMRVQAEKDGAAEEARIRAAAEDDKKKIVESAGQEIEVAARAARRNLAAYAADLAVNMARQRIEVDLPADQSLVSSFAQTLGKANQ
jgi:F-type H+-transporting ATPase subunit b